MNLWVRHNDNFTNITGIERIEVCENKLNFYDYQTYYTYGDKKPIIDYHLLFSIDFKTEKLARKAYNEVIEILMDDLTVVKMLDVNKIVKEEEEREYIDKKIMAIIVKNSKD